MTTAPAFVWTGGTGSEIRDVELPPDRPDWVRLAVAYTGLCGTDLHVLAGEHGRARPGTVLGHEFAGRLADGSPAFADPMVRCGHCDACQRGLRTICANLTAVGIDYPGAACREVLVPEANLFPLPSTMDLRVAALIEPVAVAVRAVRKSGLGAGMRAHVLGAGPIGCLLALVAQRTGATVTMSEPAPARAQAATDLGLTLSAEPGADVVFDATGVPAVAAQACDWVRGGGTLVIVGAYPPHPVGFDLLRVMFAELTVVGTRIYDRPDIEAAIDLLATDPGRIPDVVSHVLPLSRARDAVGLLRAGQAMKILLDPTES
ncbi:MAG TPA: alcohol dehydrogenase catalytic domain-containing protein [Pseudonocardiaceae bacterium]|nr:alcohol dehydrogenase catalytic domain-containing protein [Pseudonocardiaceae bacterium]